MKRREFVAGIGRDSQKRILLIKRAPTDDMQANMWSLPAGEVEDNESKISALCRELREEIGVETGFSAETCQVTREKWAVTFYDIGEVSGNITSNDPDIADTKFFAIEDLPEMVVFEALLGIYKSVLWHGDVSCIPSHWFDALLTALHYSYIEPQYQSVDLGMHSEIFQYTSRCTPFRKFKSALPFLLSQASDKCLPWAMIADAGFSVFTVLDDICDSRDIRYGNPTALRTFGLPSIATWVTGACETLSKSASSLNEPAGIEIRTAFSQFVEAQYRRLSNKDFNEKERYLDTVYYRTRFLEVIWTSALQYANCHDEANFVRENYVHLSILGQLVNDYYDLIPPTHQGAANALKYFDLQNKRVNYGWMLIWDHLKASERHLIERLVEDSNTNNNQQQLDILVKKTCGDTLLLCEIENRFDSLIGGLGNCRLNLNVKTILLEWYYRQFMAMLPLEHSYRSHHGDVFNALEIITKHVG